MMSAQVSQNARPALLSFGFRPFFLLASLWSAASLTIWVVMLFTGSALPSRFDPLAWHIHEMLFGFVLGTIAGFLLTAVANWTGREPVKGALLALLVGFWLLGRAVCLFSALTPFWFAAACDLAFPVILACVVAHEIVAARNLRNLPIIGVIAVLGLADLLMHLEAAQAIDAGGSGWRLGLAAIVILISVIAGRIVPAFTRNWLTQRNKKGVPAPPGPLDRGALGVLHAGAPAHLCAPALHLFQIVVDPVMFLKPVPLAAMLAQHGSLRWKHRTHVHEEVARLVFCCFNAVHEIQMRNGRKWRCAAPFARIIRRRRREACILNQGACRLVIAMVIGWRRRQHDLRTNLAQQTRHSSPR